LPNKKKKPDMVTETPASSPYPTNVGAPAFKLNNIVEFKQTRSSNALHHLNSRLEEIKKQYDELVDLATDTELVYSARYNFIPIVGKTYHLYNNDRYNFLSIVPPNAVSWTFLGSFTFTTDNIWSRVK
jgi:hypothetical protein